MINSTNSDIAFQPTLFMSMLGCRLQNRVSMRHDIFFGAARDIDELGQNMQAFWPSHEGDIQMDAWRRVTHVDGYSVALVRKHVQPIEVDSCLPKLFFINRGGYSSDQFAEFHSRVLVVAQDKKAAVCKLEESFLYHKIGFKSAAGIAQYKINEDDILAVDDLLPPLLRSQYELSLKQNFSGTADRIHKNHIPLHRFVSSSPAQASL